MYLWLNFRLKNQYDFWSNMLKNFFMDVKCMKKLHGIAILWKSEYKEIHENIGSSLKKRCKFIKTMIIRVLTGNQTIIASFSSSHYISLKVMKPVSSQVVFEDNPIVTGKYLNNEISAYSQHVSLNSIV